MKNSSLKVKILLTIVTLTLASLGIFSYLTFNSYKKDKLAFVYDYLASETQSKAALFTSTISHYDFFLGSIISRIDINANKLPLGTSKFLSGNSKLGGVYYHIPQRPELSQRTLYQAKSFLKEVEWSTLESSSQGLSLLDEKAAQFVLKKPLSLDGGYAALVFQDQELVNMLRSGNGRFHFLLKNGEVMTRGESFDSGSLKQIQSNLAEGQSPLGLFEVQAGEENYLVSYAKIPYDNMILTNLISEKKVFLIQEVFAKQVLIFLLLITSVSLVVGTLIARWLTLRLDELIVAAQEMENENFDMTVNVTSRDEIGTLGNAFNSMSGKIQNLLEELRRYNSQLEMMVEERTKELQNLTNIQKGMLNSLGQGFVIVDREHKVLPVYSKVAEEMFEVNPSDSTPSQIMATKPGEEETFKDFFQMVFDEMVDFSDMVQLSPDFRSNNKGQKIKLNYAPIKSETGAIDYILLIGTDKTQEIEHQEKFKKEWAFSQMIMKVVSNRFSLNKIIAESLEMLKNSIDILSADKDFAIKDVQRFIHTIKGSFSYFYISEITQQAHDLESYLEPHFNAKQCPDHLKQEIYEKIMALQISIECYIDHYDEVIQYKTAHSSKTISLKKLEEFGNILSSKDATLKQEFLDRFFRAEIAPFFQMYPSIVNELGAKLNKKVNFVLEGGQVEIPDGPWDEIFGQFIHFIRNSVDHGIESEEERLSAGKNPTGQIKFSFKADRDSLSIELSDDGRGIDWQKLAQKDPSITCEADAIGRIMEGGISSKDEVSEVSGRGVGVSAISETAKKLNGKIKFENNPGMGFKLSLELPLRTVSLLKNVA